MDQQSRHHEEAGERREQDEWPWQRAHLRDAAGEEDIPREDDDREDERQEGQEAAHQPRILVSLVTDAGARRRTKTSSALAALASSGAITSTRASARSGKE